MQRLRNAPMRLVAAVGATSLVAATSTALAADPAADEAAKTAAAAADEAPSAEPAEPAPRDSSATRVEESDLDAARETLLQGLAHLEAGEYSDALQKCTKVLKVIDAPTARVCKGRALVGLGRADESRAVFQAIVDRPASPGEPKAWVDARAQAETELGTVRTSSGVSKPLPISYATRPLTLPARTMALQFRGGFSHWEMSRVEDGFFYGTTDSVNYAEHTNGAELKGGVSFGVLDDLTVYAAPLTVTLASGGYEVVSATGERLEWANGDLEARYGVVQVGAIYRFFSATAVDLGAQLELGGTGGDDSFFYLSGKLPVLLRLGGLLRIDTGLSVSAVIPTSSGDASAGFTGVGMSVAVPRGFSSGVTDAGIPISASLQLADSFFVGADTGLGILDLGEAGDTMFMPLGGHLGVTVGKERRAALDIVGRFDVPLFLLSADPEPPLTVPWRAGLDLQGYFNLGR